MAKTKNVYMNGGDNSSNEDNLNTMFCTYYILSEDLSQNYNSKVGFY